MFFIRIKNNRIDNDLTQAQIARIIECPLVSYKRYENGYRDFPVSNIIKLSEFYNQSCDYLLNISDVKGMFYGKESSPSDRLLFARRKFHKTQDEVADMLICKRQIYGNYETGARQVPVEFIVKLSKIYHLSTDYLMGLKVRK